jgi:hypothetical protein
MDRRASGGWGERCKIYRGYRALIQRKDVDVCIHAVFKESCNFLGAICEANSSTKQCA